MNIYSFWISGPLQPVNLLTIRSFAEHGHRLIIYTYEPEQFCEVPNSLFEIWDAREILPEREIFYYKKMMGGNPAFKFGGIAERLKAEMLYQLGGWHVDLDVTCLRNFEELPAVVEGKDSPFRGVGGDYYFRPHNSHGIVANIIKAPPRSELARRYIEVCKTIDENNRVWEKGFAGLNQAVKELGLEKYILPVEIFGDDSDKYYKEFLKAGINPEPSLFAIHWCNARQLGYEKGSFYEQLLQKYNLI